MKIYEDTGIASCITMPSFIIDIKKKSYMLPQYSPMPYVAF